jgi:hypothetical protein
VSLKIVLPTIAGYNAQYSICHPKDSGMTKSVKGYFERARHLAEWPLRFLLFVAIFAALVPMSPAMPTSGLDGSWRYALGEAIARGFVFGKDIVFTLGPYSSIYTSTYHPATYLFTLFASIYVAFSFAVLFFYLLSKRPLVLSFLLLFFLSCNGGSADATFLAYPLLLSLFVFRLTLSDEDPLRIRIQRTRTKYLVIFLLFGVLGLLPLVKGSLLILATAAGGLSAARLYLTSNVRLAAISAIAIAVSLILFWVVAGQPMGGLPYYFINMFPIASGYTEAMSVKGKTAQINVYLIPCILSAIVIMVERTQTWRNKIYLLLASGLFLFIALKEGFVRHDGHATIAASALFLAGVALCTVLKGNWQWISLSAFIFSWFSITSAYHPMSSTFMVAQARDTYAHLGNGLKARLHGVDQLNADFEEARRRLNYEHPIPTLQGTTDIYPYDQSYLLASSNIWSARPVFQSYSAYTPKLAEMNRLHLLGSSAPDNIVFSLQPIDGRLPSLDDGPSWLALIDLYKPVHYENGFLYLERRKDDAHLSDVKPFFAQDIKMNEVVKLPAVATPLFTHISMKRTLIGRMESIFFKPSPLRITLNLLDGSSRDYRFVPGMGDAGFLLSPVVENTTDFILSYGSWKYLEDKKVISIKITADSKHLSGWDGYTLTLSTLPNQAHADINSLIAIAEPTKDYVRGSLASQQDYCFGSVDVINGSLTTRQLAPYSALLTVQGWIAESKDKLGDDKFVITLTEKDGTTYIAPIVRDKRPDVAAYYKSDALKNSGYKAVIKSDGFSGPIILGMGKKVSGTIILCRQFHYAIEQRVD